MREIKFRAWVKKDRKMTAITDLEYSWKERKLINVCDETFEYLIENVELMQFTGLKDKNKKEIYDGDILEYYIEDKEYFKELYEISYSEERACWQINIIKKCNHTNSPQFYLRHLTQTDDSCFKIVGNKFENPELLKC